MRTAEYHIRPKNVNFNKPNRQRKPYQNYPSGVLRYAFVYAQVFVRYDQTVFRLPYRLFLVEVFVGRFDQSLMFDADSGQNNSFRIVVLTEIREQNIPIYFVDVVRRTQFREP